MEDLDPRHSWYDPNQDSPGKDVAFYKAEAQAAREGLKAMTALMEAKAKEAAQARRERDVALFRLTRTFDYRIRHWWRGE